jgi:hypothetical protein
MNLDDLEERTRRILDTEEFEDRFTELVDLDKPYEHYEEQAEKLETEFIEENETFPVEQIPPQFNRFVRLCFREELEGKYRDALLRSEFEDLDVSEMSDEEKTEFIDSL